MFFGHIFTSHYGRLQPVVEAYSEFIINKRKAQGLTQIEVAGRLGVSFQAVSKWENGTLPNPEMLVGLAELLHVSVDELLAGREKSGENYSYSKAGVDIAYTDSMKKDMVAYLRSEDPRVLNGLGPFASLYDISFPDIKDPVLVLKSEEPGSKQKLAMEYGYGESVCHDMINHLVNDIAVMGARPLAVLDTIVCGSAEKETVKSALSPDTILLTALVYRRVTLFWQSPPTAFIQTAIPSSAC